MFQKGDGGDGDVFVVVPCSRGAAVAAAVVAAAAAVEGPLLGLSFCGTRIYIQRCALACLKLTGALCRLHPCCHILQRF